MAILRYTMRDESTFRVKAGLAEMLKGGVIMDVVTPEQAKIAESGGAAARVAAASHSAAAATNRIGTRRTARI